MRIGNAVHSAQLALILLPDTRLADWSRMKLAPFAERRRIRWDVGHNRPAGAGASRRHASAELASGSISQHHRFLAASYVPVASDVRVQYFRAQHSLTRACPISPRLELSCERWRGLLRGVRRTCHHFRLFLRYASKSNPGIMDGVHDGIYIETQDIPTNAAAWLQKRVEPSFEATFAEESARLRDAIRIDPDLPYWVYARLTEALLSASI